MSPKKTQNSFAHVLRNKGSLQPGQRGGAALQIGKAIAQKVKQAVSSVSKPKKSSKKKKKNGVGGPQIGGVPLAMGSILRNMTPETATTGRCREFVADLGTTSTAGTYSTLLDLPLNPGNTRLFNRATAIADLYEEYRFKQLRICYEPSTSVTTAGVLGMYIDYDPVDTAVSSMPALMANQSSILGPIYSPMCLDLDTSAYTLRWFYTQQQTSDTALANDRLQDPGDLRIACDKCPANAALGYVFVEYEIEFRHPKPPASLIFSSNMAALSYPSVAAGTSVYAGITLNSTLVSRGFQFEDHVTGDDETTSNLTNGPVWDIVTCSSGSANYNICMSLTFFTDVGGLPIALALYQIAAGSNVSTAVSGVSTSATSVGGSTSQTVTLSAQNVSIPSGSRLYWQLKNNGGVSCQIQTVSGYWSIGCLSVQNVGRSGRSISANLADSSQACFVLPSQGDLARSFLGGLSDGLVNISWQSTVSTVEDEKESFYAAFRQYLLSGALSQGPCDDESQDETKSQTARRRNVDGRIGTLPPTPRSVKDDYQFIPRLSLPLPRQTKQGMGGGP